MSKKNTRRQFLQTSAAVGAGVWLSGSLYARPTRMKQERIQIACVGIGGKGRSDSNDARRTGEVVAICDIDDDNLRRGSRPFPNAKQYNDFREMLSEMGDKIDAVTVSTPDHSHAVIAITAMQMGKHCFCQKPLTHSIWEARQMREVAAKTGLCTMMGNQGTAHDGLRQAANLIQNGHLGTVSEVHVWTDRPIWPQGVERPPAEEVPSTVHWDQWLGPAAERPYSSKYHPFAWRGFWDFGTGALGDMACHTLNMPFMGLDLRDPLSVEAESSGHNKESYPAKSKIVFEFGERNGRAPVKLTWYDGGNTPDASLFEGAEHEFAKTGSLIIGEKGKLYSWGDYGEEFEVFGGVTKPNLIEFEKSPGHFDEWIRHINGGQPARSNFVDYSGPLTETILLGNLAIWSGEKVMWDAETMTPKDKPELMKIVHPSFREGFEINVG